MPSAKMAGVAGLGVGVWVGGGGWGFRVVVVVVVVVVVGGGALSEVLSACCIHGLVLVQIDTINLCGAP